MNKYSRILVAGFSAVYLSSCAGMTFNATAQSDALTYYEIKPYLLLTITKDCVPSASVLSLPGTLRSVSFNNGYGTADLSVSLSNGMITSVGQKTDSKIPETITAVAGLATAASKLGLMAETPGGKSTKAVVCVPTARLYPIVEGEPDLGHPVVIEGELKTIDVGPTTP